MSQLAQQSEAQELRALLVRIDEKLDDVRRAQRDAVLAKMRSAAAAIDEAMTIRSLGGDPKTLWDKVSGSSETLLNVQEEALLALRALADKAEAKSNTGELKRALKEIEREVGVQLAILARCFELQDEFRVVELDHVLATAPENLEGHRRGVAAARQRRREVVLEGTRHLMTRIDAAGGIANENILLHARAARSVIDSLNATSAIVDDFHAPLGIESARWVQQHHTDVDRSRPTYTAPLGNGPASAVRRLRLRAGCHQSGICGHRRCKHQAEGGLRWGTFEGRTGPSRNSRPCSRPIPGGSWRTRRAGPGGEEDEQAGADQGGGQEKPESAVVSAKAKDCEQAGDGGRRG